MYVVKIAIAIWMLVAENKKLKYLTTWLKYWFWIPTFWSYWTANSIPVIALAISKCSMVYIFVTLTKPTKLTPCWAKFSIFYVLVVNWLPNYYVHHTNSTSLKNSVLIFFNYYGSLTLSFFMLYVEQKAEDTSFYNHFLTRPRINPASSFSAADALCLIHSRTNCGQRGLEGRDVVFTTIIWVRPAPWSRCCVLR